VRNRRRVVYYAILLLLILGELLGERNYIIIIFLEYDTLTGSKINLTLENKSLQIAEASTIQCIGFVKTLDFTVEYVFQFEAYI